MPHMVRPFRIAQDRDDVKADLPIIPNITHISHSCIDDLSLLSSCDLRFRSAVVRVGSMFDFNKNQDGPIPGYDIDLPVMESPISGLHGHTRGPDGGQGDLFAALAIDLLDCQGEVINW